ncbi:MAG: hypothetical protein HQK89_09325 [Nitrospirae bacterium]|nr:hypothetical protein [Nitrospirota bacterium]
MEDIDNAENILDRCDHMNIERLPIDITMYKATIQNLKGKYREALELLNQRLTDASLKSFERIRLSLSIAIYEANLGNFNETYKVLLNLWHIVKPGSDFNINDKSFYRYLSQSQIYIEPLAVLIIDLVKSYLKGKEYLHDKKYLEIYEYVKKIPDVYDVHPFEETDIEFPDEKYFILKVVTKPMLSEDKFNFEQNIQMSLKPIYPDKFILIDVIEKEDVSNRLL